MLSCLLSSGCASFEEDPALAELCDANLLLAAVLLPPDPDGLVAHGRDDRLVGAAAGRLCRRRGLDVDGLAAAEPALLVEELPVVNADLAHNTGRGGGTRAVT